MLQLIVGLAIVAVGYADPPIWSPSGCGKSKYDDAAEMPLPRRVVGGQEARSYELPWQASVRRKSSDRHFCGGSIINERWIMTASHCMDGETPDIVSIVVGEWQRSAASTVRQYLDVESIHMHPAYDPNTFESDISLVKLASDIILSEDVFPVCAPDPIDQYDHRKCEASGWGALAYGASCCPDILQYVTMNVTTNAYCQQAYTELNDAIFDDMICATDNTGSTDRDTCQGDSGGPLTVKDADGTFRLVGVTSWGIGCASGYPGVYARVGYFVDWVNDIITNN